MVKCRERRAASSPLVYMYGTDTSDMRNKYCTGQRAVLCSYAAMQLCSKMEREKRREWGKGRKMLCKSQSSQHSVSRPYESLAPLACMGQTSYGLPSQHLLLLSSSVHWYAARWEERKREREHTDIVLLYMFTVCPMDTWWTYKQTQRKKNWRIYLASLLGWLKHLSQRIRI
jgi:hypothetical protein